MVAKKLKKKDLFLDNRDSYKKAPPSQEYVLDNSKFVNKRLTTTTNRQKMELLKNENYLNHYFSDEDPQSILSHKNIHQ